MSTIEDLERRLAAEREARRRAEERCQTLATEHRALRQALAEERESAEMLERLLKEAYAKMREGGLLPPTFNFAVSEAGQSLFEALPERFTADDAFDCAARLGIPQAVGAQQLAIFVRERMVAQATTPSGKEQFRKTGRQPPSF